MNLYSNTLQYARLAMQLAQLVYYGEDELTLSKLLSTVADHLYYDYAAGALLPFDDADWLTDPQLLRQRLDREPDQGVGYLLERPLDFSEANSTLHFHWGVYIGGGEVVHVHKPQQQQQQPPQQATTISRPMRTTLAQFTAGRRCRVNNRHDEHQPPLPAAQILERALSVLSSGGVDGRAYSLTLNNCEHLATWCRYGRAFSRQVQQHSSVLSNVKQSLRRLLFSGGTGTQAKHDEM